MNTMIKATGISTDIHVNSAIKHAVIAAKSSIEASGIDVQDIGYLINVGIYRDFNIVEPSIAALIQKGIGLNPDFIKHPVNSTAFSTDLMNGAAGAINAFYVADALFKSGHTNYVLVVSSDAHPSGKPADGFPIRACGAAVLLTSTDSEQGFAQFAFNETSDEYIGESSYVDFKKQGLNGCTTITIDTDPDYHQHLLEFAGLTAKQFIETHNITLDKTALVAPSFSANFASDLGSFLGITNTSTINLWEAYGNPHTSAFGMGFHELNKQGLSDKYEQVLFVGAGAGINASCALYILRE